MLTERCWRCSCQENEDGGRPKRRYLDVAKEDMQEVGAREHEVFGCSEGRLQGVTLTEVHGESAVATPDWKRT